MALEFSRWESTGIWLTGLAVGTCLLSLAALLMLIGWQGLGHFWPAPLLQFEYDGQPVLGEVVETETLTQLQFLDANPDIEQMPLDSIERTLIKTANRRVDPPDFRWIENQGIERATFPPDATVVERTEWGHAYGYLAAIFEAGQRLAPADLWVALTTRLNRADELRAAERAALDELIEANTAAERASIDAAADEGRTRLIDAERRLAEIRRDLARDSFELRTATGERLRIEINDALRIWRPNQMTWGDKASHFASSIGRFLSEDPREANTEGGVFPALFGTVLMVMLMSVLVTPLGVLTAVYLHDYAKPGLLLTTLRIAINNLAGVPSIVFGVFGLGFFVYVVGGSLDDWLFSDRQPTPTFGAPGLLWASLTMALLTLPVVIVTTEEGLARIPPEIREGSLALGATRAESLLYVLLPMAAPSILTGIILAVARAAGEVAPLMLVGVVKLAPALPVDGTFPFVHFDRQFMHLGFHIYDVGFQSPNSDAARPLVYATALLLITIIVGLNLFAIVLRNVLDRRYRDVFG